MNKIFTQIALGMVCLFANTANAQTVTENFTNGLPTGSCWQSTGYKVEAHKGNNVASTQGSASSILTTPYIDIPANGDVRFVYSTTEKTPIGLSFTIKLIDTNGNITLLASQTMAGTGNTSYDSPDIIGGGTYRVVIEFINTGNSNGSTFSRLDDVVISGAINAKGCNLAAPDAIDDTDFTTTSITAVASGNMLTNDIANTGETIAVIDVVQPSTGTVTWDAAGNFTFTPNSTFTGGAVTFSYTIADDGYAPLTDAAVVTITYPVAPVAVDDNYSSISASAPVSGNVVSNDTNPNEKVLIATVTKQPISGTLAFNADGTFTYTPAEGFTGGPITFTYTITDESYSPLSSNTATVTIDYATAVVLPVKLVSFSGKLNTGKAQLTWSVADNETGSYFDIEKSVDGKSFKSAGIVFSSNRAGTETYVYTDPATLSTITYYRLKTVNKDKTVTYSTVVSLRSEQTEAGGKLTLLQNPVQNTISFTFTSLREEKAEVAIYNMAGVKMQTQYIQVRKGTNSISLAMDSKFIKGNYILTVQSNSSNRSAQLIK